MQFVTHKSAPAKTCYLSLGDRRARKIAMSADVLSSPFVSPVVGSSSLTGSQKERRSANVISILDKGISPGSGPW